MFRVLGLELTQNAEKRKPETVLTSKECREALYAWAKCPQYFYKERLFNDLVIAEPDVKLGIELRGEKTWLQLDYKDYTPIRDWIEQSGSRHPNFPLSGHPFGRFEGTVKSKWNGASQGGLALARFKTEKMGERQTICRFHADGERIRVGTITVSVFEIQLTLSRMLCREMVRRSVDPTYFTRSCEISRNLSLKRMLLCNFSNWLTSPEIDPRAEELPKWGTWTEELRKARATYQTFLGMLDIEIASEEPRKDLAHASEYTTPDDANAAEATLDANAITGLRAECGKENRRLMNETSLKPAQRLVLLRTQFPQLNLDKNKLQTIQRTDKNRTNAAKKKSS